MGEREGRRTVGPATTNAELAAILRTIDTAHLCTLAPWAVEAIEEATTRIEESPDND